VRSSDPLSCRVRSTRPWSWPRRGARFSC
jgi:hypothetical protein